MSAPKRALALKEQNCLYPGDLFTFTRKPLFVIVDSDNRWASQKLQQAWNSIKSKSTLNLKTYSTISLQLCIWKHGATVRTASRGSHVTWRCSPSVSRSPSQRKPFYALPAQSPIRILFHMSHSRHTTAAMGKRPISCSPVHGRGVKSIDQVWHYGCALLSK